MQNTQYKMPEMRNGVSGKARYIFLIWPLVVIAVGYVQFIHGAERVNWGDLVFAGIFAMVFGSGVLMAIVNIVNEIVGGPGSQRRLKQHWNQHSYAWYRSTFPEHAHANGRVSCRHCGGHKLRVTNLMKQTYMRVHNCAQCGETLYFTPEKI
jgi:hypothetical protein